MIFAVIAKLLAPLFALIYVEMLKPRKPKTNHKGEDTQ